MAAEFLVKDIVISVIIAAFGSQFLKMLTFSHKRKKLFWRAILKGGGMPSGHSAFATALAAGIGLNQGFSTPIFVFAICWALLVVYQVLIEKNLADLVITMVSEKHPNKHAVEELGHTIMEVLVGILIGILIVVAVYHN